MTEQNEFKAGYIALAGRSNAGKSTLMNALVGEKVAIVSDRPQTTRNIIRGVLNGDGYQMVFVDTPGLHVPKNRLGEYMVHAVDAAISGVDLVMAVFDASEGIGGGDRAVLDKLEKSGLPVVAVLNKIDKVAEKHTLLEKMAKLSERPCIKEIVPISALKQDGLTELVDTLFKYLPQGERVFPVELYTDQTERQIAAEMIREKALNNLREEIPHGIGVEILEMKETEDGQVNINANILCEKESHKGIIIGKQGALLRLIGTQARKDIARMLDTPVFLELWVKVKPDWRDNLSVMRDLGYDRRRDE